MRTELVFINPSITLTKLLCAFLSISLLSSCSLAPKTYEFSLGQFSSFHGDEVSLTSGDKVYIFHQEGEDFYLSKDKVRVKTFFDEITETDDGKEISLRDKSSEKKYKEGFHFLIKTNYPLKLGKLPQASFDKDACFDGMVPKKCNIALGEKSYLLTVIGAEVVTIDGSSEPELKYNFTISDGVRAQEFKSVSKEGLVWLGDLDRDGGLDVLTNDLYHYNVWLNLKLYLSQTADALMKLVAKLEAVGC